MDNGNNLELQKDTNIVNAADSTTHELEIKLKKQKDIAWTICLSSFILILVSILAMSMSWYPDRILQGWPMIISIMICLCSLIVAINQSVKYSKSKRAAQATSNDQSQPLGPKPLKNSSANSVVSLVCAIIPIILYSWYSIYALSRPHSNSDQSGWTIVIYYWTAGFWLMLVWLICGILGLKSEKRKMAIASLIIKPVGFVIFLLLMLIAAAR